MFEKLYDMAASGYTTLLLVGVIIIVAILVARYASNMKKETLNRQAMKREGYIKKGKLFSQPCLKLPRLGGEIDVFSQSEIKSLVLLTIMRCTFNASREYNFCVYPEASVLSGETIFGQEMSMSKPIFDRAFVVKATDEFIIPEFLTTDIQEILLGMRDLAPTIEVQKNQLRFFINGIPDDEQQYDQFIDNGLLIIKRIEEIG